MYAYIFIHDNTSAALILSYQFKLKHVHPARRHYINYSCAHKPSHVISLPRDPTQLAEIELDVIEGSCNGCRSIAYKRAAGPSLIA